MSKVQTSSALQRFKKSDMQWRQQLSEMEYQVTRHAATEPAFTGHYWDHWENGVYRCVCCDTPLFESKAKFDAGCGWPSFTQPIEGGIIAEKIDHSLGMVRTEVRCQACDAHLGHVFTDGPTADGLTARPRPPTTEALPATGQRYCINSAALKFSPTEG